MKDNTKYKVKLVNERPLRSKKEIREALKIITDPIKEKDFLESLRRLADE